MEKIDLKKQLKHFYNPSAKEFSLVQVPPFNFAMIDGSGDPNTAQEYQDAIEALYAVSYSLKFRIKKERDIDYGVMPLEGLWWADDMSRFGTSDKSDWKWTAMIMQPEFITRDLFDAALAEVGKKKSLRGLSQARFQTFTEGLAAQIMFVGPFANEGPTIERLHRFIRDRGYTINGLVQKHHEIYLSDFRKTAPEKLKTVIRQPMVK